MVEAIITTQRDHGNRDDRNRARLKYLLEERGIDWLREQIETRTGLTLAPPVALPEFRDDAHFHWHEIDGVDTLGLPVPSGKVVGGYRDALRELVAGGHVSELRVTARQDMLLVGATDRAKVESILHDHGVTLASDQTPIRSLSIACVALPTCSKALGEAERVLPDVVDHLEKLLADTGNTGLPLRLNMTGCPNGCARPYGAELGIVGRTKKNYDIYVGGNEQGDRLAELLRADVPLTDVPELLRPLLERFSAEHAMAIGDSAESSGSRLGAKQDFRTGRSGSGTGARRTTWPSCRRCCPRRPAVAAGSVPRPTPTPSDRDMTVWLVGAGPGDPELLTVRAARLIAAADVIVHDALVGDGVLALVPDGVELIDVGKRPGSAVPQEEISALLVELGRLGRAGRAPEGRRSVRVRPRRRGGAGPAGRWHRLRGGPRRHVRGERADGRRCARDPSGRVGGVHRGDRPPARRRTGHRLALARQRRRHDRDPHGRVATGVDRRRAHRRRPRSDDPGRGDPLRHHRRRIGDPLRARRTRDDRGDVTMRDRRRGRRRVRSTLGA